MFSNINDAWNLDPVREMTEKLSKGCFKKEPSRADIFNFKDMGRGINNSRVKSDNSVVLSEKSIDLSSDYESYAPIDFGHKSESDSEEFSYNDSKCSYSYRHLKKCDRCYYQMKKIIDRKVEKKLDDYILDMKMKQIQSQTQPYQIPFRSYETPESVKEMVIIMFGMLIALFIIFMIVKNLSK